MKKRIAFLVMVGVLAAGVACQKIEAAFPQLENAATVVENDLKVNDPPSAIEQDVARALAGQPGVDVVIALQEIVRTLIDFGDLPAVLVAPANALIAAEASKQAAGVHLRIGVEIFPGEGGVVLPPGYKPLPASNTSSRNESPPMDGPVLLEGRGYPLTTTPSVFDSLDGVLVGQIALEACFHTAPGTSVPCDVMLGPAVAF